MLTYRELTFGESLEFVVNEMIKLAKDADMPVTTEFNGIRVYADANSDVDKTVDRFLRDAEQRYDAYRNSPAGLAAAAEAEATRGKLQQRADDLMSQIDGLDFNDDVAVLQWLCDLQYASDHIGVKIDIGRVLKTFGTNGYLPNVNCGDEFDGECMVNVHRYIVGQALDGLREIGAIHHIIHRFAENWRNKFVSKPL